MAARLQTRPLMTADSSGSVDSELSQLVKEFPGYTQMYLHNLISGKEQVDKAKLQRQTQPFANELSRLPQSDYKSTYIPKNARPRSSKRPLRTPPVSTVPSAPTNFETAYKAEFKPLDLSGRAVTMKKSGNTSQFTAVDAEGAPPVSDYKENFVPLDLLRAHQDASHRPRTQTRLPANKFEATTTNKLHFSQPVPLSVQFSYGELPSFAGSIIFPNGKSEQQSTSMAAYQPHAGKARMEASKPKPANLKPEGSMDMTTVHRSVYKPLSFETRLPKFPAPKDGLKLTSDDPSLYRSQSMDDFQYRPCAPAPAAEPARSHINLQFDNRRRNFETEQRSQFRGIDTSVHPPSKPVKRNADDSAMKLAEKFDDSTFHKLTYTTHDLSCAYSAPVPPKAGSKNLLTSDPNFFSATTAKEHFRDWSPYMDKERFRHGDFTEALNSFLRTAQAGPVAKFETRTTFRDDFVPLSHEKVKKVAPAKGSLLLEGERDFNTAYSTAYVPPKPRLSREDMKKLKAYLQNLKAGKMPKADEALSRQKTC